MSSLAVVLTIALAQAGAEPTSTPVAPSDGAATVPTSAGATETGAPANAAEPPKPDEFHAAVPVAVPPA
jgi:hypothetical protein